MPPPENVNFPVFIMVPVLTFYWQVKYQNPIKKLGNVEYFGLVLCMQFTLLFLLFFRESFNCLKMTKRPWIHVYVLLFYAIYVKLLSFHRQAWNNEPNFIKTIKMYLIIPMSNDLLLLKYARPFNEFKNSGNF